MSKSRSVCVVGGGFAGMVAAAALARVGCRVQVFEVSPSTDQRFRGELIHPRGVRGLDALGLKAPLLAAGGVEVEGFAVSAHGSPYDDLTLLPYGEEHGRGLGIDHREMVLALRKEVGARRHVEITTGLRVDDFVRAGDRVVGVKTADGVEHRAELVLVADGRGSKLRALLGMEPEVKLLSHTIALGVTAELPCGPHGHVFLGGPGPILAYPFGAGRVRFCVDVPLGAAKGKAAIVRLLETDYAKVIPSVQLREALLHALRTEDFEGAANQSISTRTCAAKGVVLAGDSGGCAHPLTASGMTNAVNDALTLADLVGSELHLDDALAEYQRRRYDFIRMRELFTDSLYEIFRGQDAGSLALQQGVFAYWRGSERARRESMDILSGENVQLTRFAVEYARVMRNSARDVLRRGVRHPRREAPKLRALAKTGLGRLSEAVERTTRKVVDRYRLELHELT